MPSTTLDEKARSGGLDFFAADLAEGLRFMRG